MLIDRNDAQNLCDILRRAGLKIVFTNGCFDILHAGHVEYLTTAKSFGDVLIVGLNDDFSVKRLKGNSRLFNCQENRAKVLLALKVVDHVIVFCEDTAANLIAEIKPDVYVKGGDYTLETQPDKIVQQHGGRVEIVDLLTGRRATNNSVDKIAGKIS